MHPPGSDRQPVSQFDRVRQGSSVVVAAVQPQTREGGVGFTSTTIQPDRPASTTVGDRLIDARDQAPTPAPRWSTRSRCADDHGPHRPSRPSTLAGAAVVAPSSRGETNVFDETMHSVSAPDQGCRLAALTSCCSPPDRSCSASADPRSAHRGPARPRRFPQQSRFSVAEGPRRPPRAVPPPGSTVSSSCSAVARCTRSAYLSLCQGGRSCSAARP